MGGSHSRSEDLRKRAFLSGSYTDSFQEIPGYFTRTQQTIDFLGQNLSSEGRLEMSYNGPPSHLQHSPDVHPFLDRFGPNFHPRERFVDRSHDSDVPPSMLPAAASAKELREIEVRETMASLKMQVQETLAKKRDQSVVPSQSPDDRPDSALPTDEQNTLEFLDSIISESMDIDLGSEHDEDDEPEKKSDPEANWIMRDKTMNPLPGLMHSTVPSVPEDPPVTPMQPNSRPASGFFRNSMYLPDTDPIHSPSRAKQPPPPTKPKPANRRSQIISVEDFPPRDYPQDGPMSTPVPLDSNHTRDLMISKEERSGSKDSSNASTEDMGIVVDDVASDEGSRIDDANKIYDTKSRVRGVRALVSMYSEEATSPTQRRPDSFDGTHLPVRDYVFHNNNNSNTEKRGSVAGKGKRFGTISSQDSALGESNRDLVEDAVLGVIHSELQKLRIN